VTLDTLTNGLISLPFVPDKLNSLRQDTSNEREMAIVIIFFMILMIAKTMYPKSIPSEQTSNYQKINTNPKRY
jgi:hypothetical protein